MVGGVEVDGGNWCAEAKTCCLGGASCVSSRDSVSQSVTSFNTFNAFQLTLPKKKRAGRQAGCIAFRAFLFTPAYP